jgi:DNA repair exonuclease SbcCD nuclease subunit
LSEIALFGDLHVYKHLSRTIFEDTAIQFLYDFADHCKENGIKKFIFLGDWFHVKSKIYVPAYIRSMEALEYMKKLGIEMYFLIGNHDMPLMNTTDTSIIKSFHHYGKVINDYDWIDDGDTRMHLLSYTHELPEFEMGDSKNILFGHLDILNFSMDGIVCREGFDRNQFDVFDQVFSGHFHKHQSVGNICYVGSPYQTRYSERFDDKGFIVLNPETAGWKFEVYSHAPKFKEVDIDDFKPEDVEGNFVRIKTHKDKSDLAKIKQDLLDAGAQTVDFIFEKEEVEGELNVLEDLSMGSMDELASDYYDNVKENKLFEKDITELIDSGELAKEDFSKVFNDIKEAHLIGWKPEDEDKELLS